jgi:ring-1,2-phenylacetyl-CoA epoxidase subunit PaaD
VSTGTTSTTVPRARDIAATVLDPELPMVTIEDLGILRDVTEDDQRRVHVTITPTYSGCPAMDVIERHIAHVAAKAGWSCTVETRLSPAWTTDWMSERGRERLREFGIAPPSGHRAATTGTVSLSLQRRQVACPQCGSTDTEEIARFGSTACKALRRCLTCREPFDEFKTL